MSIFFFWPFLSIKYTVEVFLAEMEQEKFNNVKN